MQIITMDDVEFPNFLQRSKQGREVGRYWSNDRIHLVFATSQFLIVWCEEGPVKIAIKPTRTQNEAVAFGRHLLKREAKRGSRVELGDAGTEQG